MQVAYMNEINYIGTIGVIPARGGSKRLPGKNLLSLGGKPLLQWSIEAAVRSDSLDMVVVSSDDDKILAYAASQGVKTISRPAELATDQSSTVDAVLHALSEVEKWGVIPEQVMLLQPTSPLRLCSDISSCIGIMKDRISDSVVSVCAVDHSPLWCNTLPDNLSMSDFLSREVLGKRSQDLPNYYRLNGSIYLAKVSEFKDNKTFFLKNSYAYIMDVERSIDIDTKMDYEFACYLIEKNIISVGGK